MSPYRVKTDETCYYAMPLAKIIKWYYIFVFKKKKKFRKWEVLVGMPTGNAKLF